MSQIPSRRVLLQGVQRLRSGGKLNFPPRWAASLLVLGSVALSGCHARPAHVFPTARSALDRLREQSSCSRAVQGEAKLNFSGDGRRLNGKVLYLAAAPERLRLDVLSPFGVTLSTLTSDGDRFGLFSMEEKAFFYGPAATCNVQRFTRVPAPPFALVELLRGQPPVLKHSPELAQLEYKSPLFGGGYYQIHLTGAQESEQILHVGVHPDDWEAELSQQRLRLYHVQVSQAGRTLYEVNLSGHAAASRKMYELSAEEQVLGLPPPAPSGPACDAELPRRVEFYVEETGYELGFRMEEVWHNPPLHPEVFRQERPGGSVAVESLCEEPPAQDLISQEQLSSLLRQTNRVSYLGRR